MIAWSDNAVKAAWAAFHNGFGRRMEDALDAAVKAQGVTEYDFIKDAAELFSDARRQEIRAEAFEEAAKIADDDASPEGNRIAAAIRNLAKEGK